MATFLYRLGHFAVRRRRVVLGFWVVLLVGVGVFSSAAGGETVDSLELPGTESQQAFDLLEDKFPAQSGSSTRVVFAAEDGATLNDPGALAVIDSTMASINAMDEVGSAISPTETGTISPDGAVAFGDVRYPVQGLEVEESTLEDVEAAVASAEEAGITVRFGGEVIPGAETEPPSSEAIGLAVAVVVLLVSFGSVLAMGLPLFTALIGLGVGLTGISLLSAVVDLSSTAPILATMIGLAVGIDYALFIVTRHRQNLAEGLNVEEAAARANATAGSAVVFAGITVVIALSGLAVMGLPFLTVMGLSAAATVAIAVLVAVTLLPSMLGFAGNNIDRWRVPGLKNRTGGADEGETLGSRWARQVTKRPVIALIGGLVVMGALAVPVSSMRLGLTDAGSSPPSSTQRQAYDLLADGFGPGFNGPFTVVVDLAGADNPEAALADTAETIGAVDGIGAVAPPQLNETGDTAVLAAIPTSSPSSEETENLVHDIRDDIVPEIENGTGAEVFLTGSTASNIDISDKLSDALPLFIAMVVGLTMLLLMAVFRSILVPIKAALAILLSIASSFGVIVAIFQWGWLKDLVGIEETIPIISFLPMMMFAILFGLSMDYEVFIL
ncbi:MAG: MMPL family transporter, partial [Microthrixaceae bacterium]|nr:MMPL family transporter [Microthrixaceae bacterium]